MLHLASLGFCLADTSPAQTTRCSRRSLQLKVQYADVLGGAPPGMPPDRGIGAVREAHRPARSLLDPTLGCGPLVVFHCPRASQTGRGVSASTSGPWGLNSITLPAVELLPHIGLAHFAPNSICPAAIIRRWCWLQTNRRRAFWAVPVERGSLVPFGLQGPLRC